MEQGVCDRKIEWTARMHLFYPEAEGGLRKSLQSSPAGRDHLGRRVVSYQLGHLMAKSAQQQVCLKGRATTQIQYAPGTRLRQPGYRFIPDGGGAVAGVFHDVYDHIVKRQTSDRSCSLVRLATSVGLAAQILQSNSEYSREVPFPYKRFASISAWSMRIMSVALLPCLPSKGDQQKGGSNGECQRRCQIPEGCSN